MSTLLLYVLLLTNPSSAQHSSSLPLKCKLLHTEDSFWFYKEQLVYESEQFILLQNFKGRTVTQVDMKTGELIRTTYIGEPYDPKYQILLGKCLDVSHTLKMWRLDDVPYEN
ncbi:hypothetical protein VITU102760_03845 [Vibrio tubiashii]|uniref:Uncharacterized protein n=1 Tax=Vibrio tubiashii ATCC 19109 TaxID=1051646 RepID=F9T4X5_9VIBR|nr:hypothetical protein [Vibrio tubiashii]AIW16754.1 hypothetical protein IX91_21985 [Vibrio tubiashii ATCC 19109]EGU55462.1 hypothetical protein VITU9109_07403 [Vibrio tubiashii ATCC 19109]EIF02099.1 hypothetical protein VT1337_20247 [Vibrio tubiashii NCIMB 1337 = ATCC 19106]